MMGKLVKKFNFLARANYNAKVELNNIANQIQSELLKVYNSNEVELDALLRRRYNFEKEKNKWDLLSKHIHLNHIKLLDCAFGSGRDLLISKKLGFDTYGCELCDKYYDDFILNYPTMKKKVKLCDMRELDFPNEMFDVVRHNASFLHMPIISKGLTIHKVLEETHRVLRPLGIVYVYTKAGEGFQAYDTGEGFGQRPFQLFSEKSLSIVLEECGFLVEFVDTLSRVRKIRTLNEGFKVVKINWIEAIARKKK